MFWNLIFTFQQLDQLGLSLKGLGKGLGQDELLSSCQAPRQYSR